MRLSNNPIAALALMLGCSGANDLPRPPLGGAAPTARTDTVPLPPEAGDPQGARGTSGMGASRYDAVGYASRHDEVKSGTPNVDGAIIKAGAITAAHRALPPGSYAEVTSLQSGRSIVVLINERKPDRADREIDLSPGAATLLGMTDATMMPVRVRSARVAPADAAALAAGKPATPRLDSPPVLLARLRSLLRPAVAPPAGSALASRPRASALIGTRTQAKTGRYLIQIGAYASDARAKALAATLNGHVESAGKLHRVRLGPFANHASAERARDDAARRGYGEAKIIVQPRVERP